MARSLTVAMQTALRDMVVRPCWLIKIEFVGTDFYLSSRAMDISWNGHTWLGSGSLSGIEGLAEAKDSLSSEVSIVLGGHDSTLLSLVLSNTNQSKACEIYFGMLDSNNALIADPYLRFTGKFDTAEVSGGLEGASITINYQNNFARAKRMNVFRFTHESQQSLFPGDLGFQYVSQAADWKGFWGKVTVPKVNQKKKRDS